MAYYHDVTAASKRRYHHYGSGRQDNPLGCLASRSIMKIRPSGNGRPRYR